MKSARRKILRVRVPAALQALWASRSGTLWRIAACQANHLSSLRGRMRHRASCFDRSIRDYKLPEDIPWRERANGNASAVLVGDPAAPAFYVELLKRHPNDWARPHSHENDRYITVLEEALWAGTGPFHPDRTVPLKPGTFIRNVGNTVHFDGTKNDGVTLLMIGVGPARGRPAARLRVRRSQQSVSSRIRYFR